MPDPFTVLTILSAASKGASAIGDYQSAGEEEAFNSGIAEINRTLALQSADDAIIKGQQRETMKRIDTAKLAGRQRVGFAASGVVVDEGSADAILDETLALGELDAQIIRNNAEREALAFETQAEGERLKGELAESRGKSKKRASGLSLITDAINFFG